MAILPFCTFAPLSFRVIFFVPMLVIATRYVSFVRRAIRKDQRAEKLEDSADMVCFKEHNRAG